MEAVLIFSEQGQQCTAFISCHRGCNYREPQPTTAWRHTSGLWWTPELSLPYLCTGTDRNNLLPGEWQHFPAPVVLSLPHLGSSQSTGISRTECKHRQGTALHILKRQLHFCHLKDQALEHNGKGRESSRVQWNGIAQSWRAWATHFCSVKTPQISDPWREEKKKKSNCALPVAA